MTREYISLFNSLSSFLYDDYESYEDKLIIRAPGLSKQSINIKLENSYLKIDGSFKMPNSNNYAKVFKIRYDVDQDKVKAKYEDGILEIYLPPKNQSGKTIKIE